jgi:nucleotide-binding universal stress UspA family protein
MKKILAPIDFSPATAHVLEAATSLATDLDAEIILFHSVQPPAVTSDYGLAMENVQEIVSLTQKAAQRQLEHSLRALSARGIKAHSESSTGSAVNAIVGKATEIDAAYIIMGSHGHTALYDLLVGSTTHGVLKNSPCPVVIVPASKTAA